MIAALKSNLAIADNYNKLSLRPAKTGRRQAHRPWPAEIKQKKPREAPAGRARARTGARSEWDCHVGIEWIQSWQHTPHLGGLGAGRGGGRSTKIAEAV